MDTYFGVSSGQRTAKRPREEGFEPSRKKKACKRRPHEELMARINMMASSARFAPEGTFSCSVFPFYAVRIEEPEAPLFPGVSVQESQGEPMEVDYDAPPQQYWH